MSQKLSPENYVRTKARSLPLGECYVNDNWHECGMASIIVSRKHSNGNFTVGIYLVDTFARGTKDTFFRFNVDRDAFDEIINGSGELVPADYTLVHNIIFGANAFAEEHGFKINKEFRITQYILEDDEDESIELMDIEFGQDEMPLLIDSRE